MIHHVSLESDRADADAHRAFWTGLGFAEVAPPESLRGCSIWFERHGTQVHLLFVEAPVVAPRGHVALRVGSLDELDLELEERTRHWGERRALTRAPGGHLVELFETPP